MDHRIFFEAALLGIPQSTSSSAVKRDGKLHDNNNNKERRKVKSSKQD
jgi:hypothetical protein